MTSLISHRFTFPRHFGLDRLTVSPQPGVRVWENCFAFQPWLQQQPPVRTLMRLVGGMIWPAPWPECYSLSEPDFLERTSTWPCWTFSTLQESLDTQGWCWWSHKSNNHEGDICCQDLAPYCVLGTAIRPLRRWPRLISTTTLERRHGSKKDPLPYLIRHSSFERIAMAKCKVMWQTHDVCPLPDPTRPSPHARRSFKDLRFYWFGHVARKKMSYKLVLKPLFWDFEMRKLRYIEVKVYRVPTWQSWGFFFFFNFFFCQDFWLAQKLQRIPVYCPPSGPSVPILSLLC